MGESDISNSLLYSSHTPEVTHGIREKYFSRRSSVLYTTSRGRNEKLPPAHLQNAPTQGAIFSALYPLSAPPSQPYPLPNKRYTYNYFPKRGPIFIFDKRKNALVALQKLVCWRLQQQISMLHIFFNVFFRLQPTSINGPPLFLFIFSEIFAQSSQWNPSE